MFDYKGMADDVFSLHSTDPFVKIKNIFVK